MLHMADLSQAGRDDPGTRLLFILTFVLMKELQNRNEQKGYNLEWADVIQNLNRLIEIEIEHDGKCSLLRTESTGTCEKMFQASGVTLERFTPDEVYVGTPIQLETP